MWPRTTVRTLLWAKLLHAITIKGAVCIFHGQCHRSFAKENVCKVAFSPFLRISSHKEIQPPLTESYVRKRYINGKKIELRTQKMINMLMLFWEKEIYRSAVGSAYLSKRKLAIMVLEHMCRLVQFNMAWD